MNIFEWVKNKKVLEKEMENIDRDLMLLKTKIAELKLKLKELEIIKKEKNDYLETIKKQRIEIKILKKQLKESGK